MRSNSPAVYACPKHRYGMHTWFLNQRSKSDPHKAVARCCACGLEVEGQDAIDLQRGAEL